MATVICEPCIACKDRACVAVCPCDCIHEGSRMLYIDPQECIDCGACAPVCPVTAIFIDFEVPERWRSFIRENAEFYERGEPCVCHPAGT
jgi:ferredoxin